LIFHLIKTMGICLPLLSGIFDLIWCPLVMDVYFETESGRGEAGKIPPYYLPVALVALAIVALWVTNDRRRRQGKSWF